LYLKYISSLQILIMFGKKLTKEEYLQLQEKWKPVEKNLKFTVLGVLIGCTITFVSLYTCGLL
ncbi:MAG: hypothetical protein OEZ01_17075, partial [Candidatus Heimdallarchaeota archaeon]|nr:hypothetical protein [Candidatus Heimdallarchaeota archaeon]